MLASSQAPHAFPVPQRPVLLTRLQGESLLTNGLPGACQKAPYAPAHTTALCLTSLHWVVVPIMVCGIPGVSVFVDTIFLMASSLVPLCHILRILAQDVQLFLYNLLWESVICDL